MHKPIVTTPSRRSSTIARYTVLGSLVFCTHFALVVIASIVLTRFWLILSSADETSSDCVQVVDVQCSMFMAEWRGRHPTHGAGKASELRLLVSFVKQRLHSSSLLKGNGWKRERQTKGQKVTWKHHYSKPHQQYDVHWMFHSETHVLKDPETLMHFRMAFNSVGLMIYTKPWIIWRRSWVGALTFFLCWIRVEKAQI